VGLAGETCALAEVVSVGTEINATKARAAISFFMTLLQLTDGRPFVVLQTACGRRPALCSDVKSSSISP